MATHCILFPSFLAAIAAAVLIGWSCSRPAKIESAEAQGGTTTEATLARTGAKATPAAPKLSVEPAGYR